MSYARCTVTDELRMLIVQAVCVAIRDRSLCRPKTPEERARYAEVKAEMDLRFFGGPSPFEPIDEAAEEKLDPARRSLLDHWRARRDAKPVGEAGMEYSEVCALALKLGLDASTALLLSNHALDSHHSETTWRRYNRRPSVVSLASVRR